MSRLLVLLGLGLLVPIVQGALAPFLPRGVLPDLGLLVVMALGIALRSTGTGLALSAFLGFVSDLLSGALLGQHALLRVMAFGVARVTGSHMNLQGPFTQMGLGAGLAAATALGTLALTAFFDPGAARALPGSELLWHAAANAVAAPFVVGAVVRLLARVEDDGRRPLRLSPRSFSA